MNKLTNPEIMVKGEKDRLLEGIGGCLNKF